MGLPLLTPKHKSEKQPTPPKYSGNAKQRDFNYKIIIEDYDVDINGSKTLKKVREIRFEENKNVHSKPAKED